MLDGRIRENPFYVLELRPGCTRGQVEHQGQKLLQMLDMGFAEATTYPTPLGEQERTPERVRRAMHELRDVERRRKHEPWATLPATPLPPLPPDRLAPWPDALMRFGW